MWFEPCLEAGERFFLQAGKAFAGVQQVFALAGVDVLKPLTGQIAFAVNDGQNNADDDDNANPGIHVRITEPVQYPVLVGQETDCAEKQYSEHDGK